MKIFWIDERGDRNQHSPWYDRRVGEIAIRYIPGDPYQARVAYIPGRVERHISARLVKHLRRVGSPLGQVYLNT